jgi:hypothetical protein
MTGDKKQAKDDRTFAGGKSIIDLSGQDIYEAMKDKHRSSHHADRGPAGQQHPQKQTAFGILVVKID